MDDDWNAGHDPEWLINAGADEPIDPEVKNLDWHLGIGPKTEDE